MRNPAENEAPEVNPHAHAEARPAPQHQARGGGAHQNGRPGAVAQPRLAASSAPAQPGGSALAQGQNGRSVQVSLQSILDGLPVELQGRVLERQVGDLTISIPLEKVLSQLSRGSVRITFGELRALAPNGARRACRKPMYASERG